MNEYLTIFSFRKTFFKGKNVHLTVKMFLDFIVLLGLIMNFCVICLKNVKWQTGHKCNEGEGGP